MFIKRCAVVGDHDQPMRARHPGRQGDPFGTLIEQARLDHRVTGIAAQEDRSLGGVERHQVDRVRPAARGRGLAGIVDPPGDVDGLTFLRLRRHRDLCHLQIGGRTEGDRAADDVGGVVVVENELERAPRADPDVDRALDPVGNADLGAAFVEVIHRQRADMGKLLVGQQVRRRCIRIDGNAVVPAPGICGADAAIGDGPVDRQRLAALPARIGRDLLDLQVCIGDRHHVDRMRHCGDVVVGLAGLKHGGVLGRLHVDRQPVRETRRHHHVERGVVSQAQPKTAEPVDPAQFEIVRIADHVVAGGHDHVDPPGFGPAARALVLDPPADGDGRRVPGGEFRRLDIPHHEVGMRRQIGPQGAGRGVVVGIGLDHIAIGIADGQQVEVPEDFDGDGDGHSVFDDRARLQRFGALPFGQDHVAIVEHVVQGQHDHVAPVRLCGAGASIGKGHVNVDRLARGHLAHSLQRRHTQVRAVHRDPVVRCGEVRGIPGLEHPVRSIGQDQDGIATRRDIGEGQGQFALVAFADIQVEGPHNRSDQLCPVQRAVGRQVDVVDPGGPGDARAVVANAPPDHRLPPGRGGFGRGDAGHGQVRRRPDGQGRLADRGGDVVGLVRALEHRVVSIGHDQEMHRPGQSAGQIETAGDGVAVASGQRSGARDLAQQDIVPVEHRIGRNVDGIGPTACRRVDAQVAHPPFQRDAIAVTGGGRGGDDLDLQVGNRRGQADLGQGGVVAAGVGFGDVRPNIGDDGDPVGAGQAGWQVDLGRHIVEPVGFERTVARDFRQDDVVAIADDRVAGQNHAVDPGRHIGPDAAVFDPPANRQALPAQRIVGHVEIANPQIGIAAGGGLESHHRSGFVAARTVGRQLQHAAAAEFVPVGLHQQPKLARTCHAVGQRHGDLPRHPLTRGKHRAAMVDDGVVGRREQGLVVDVDTIGPAEPGRPVADIDDIIGDSDLAPGLRVFRQDAQVLGDDIGGRDDVDRGGVVRFGIAVGVQLVHRVAGIGRHDGGELTDLVLAAGPGHGGRAGNGVAGRDGRPVIPHVDQRQFRPRRPVSQAQLIDKGLGCRGAALVPQGPGDRDVIPGLPVHRRGEGDILDHQIGQRLRGGGHGDRRLVPLGPRFAGGVQRVGKDRDGQLSGSRQAAGQLHHGLARPACPGGERPALWHLDHRKDGGSVGVADHDPVQAVLRRLIAGVGQGPADRDGAVRAHRPVGRQASDPEVRAGIRFPNVDRGRRTKRRVVKGITGLRQRPARPSEQQQVLAGFGQFGPVRVVAEIPLDDLLPGWRNEAPCRGTRYRVHVDGQHVARHHRNSVGPQCGAGHQRVLDMPVGGKKWGRAQVDQPEPILTDVAVPSRDDHLVIPRRQQVGSVHAGIAVQPPALFGDPVAAQRPFQGRGAGLAVEIVIPCLGEGETVHDAVSGAFDLSANGLVQGAVDETSHRFSDRQRHRAGRGVQGAVHPNEKRVLPAFQCLDRADVVADAVDGQKPPRWRDKAHLHPEAGGRGRHCIEVIALAGLQRDGCRRDLRRWLRVQSDRIQIGGLRGRKQVRQRKDVITTRAVAVAVDLQHIVAGAGPDHGLACVVDAVQVGGTAQQFARFRRSQAPLYLGVGAHGAEEQRRIRSQREGVILLRQLRVQRGGDEVSQCQGLRAHPVLAQREIDREGRRGHAARDPQQVGAGFGQCRREGVRE